jgi:ribose transport system ATP-binding protein
VRGLSKTFPGLKALADVDLDVHAGEIVALVGQNGSGKSTLVKVLAGVHEAGAGGSVEACAAGGRVVQHRPGETRDLLHFIHQDLGLIPSLSTVENFDLFESYGFRMVRPRRKEERRHAQRLVRDLGADIDVDAPVSSLTASERAIVAIARALDGWTSPEQVLVLDEPTAALRGKEGGRHGRRSRPGPDGAGTRCDQPLDPHRPQAGRGECGHWSRSYGRRPPRSNSV